MLEVEAALAEAEAQMGLVPPEAAQEIRSKASTRYVTNERVAEIEKETNHDIASIVKALAEVCDGEAGEYVHFGATSNDIIDSSQSLLLQESIDIIQDKITRLVKIVLKLADENKKNSLYR